MDICLGAAARLMGGLSVEQLACVFRVLACTMVSSLIASFVVVCYLVTRHLGCSTGALPRGLLFRIAIFMNVSPLQEVQGLGRCSPEVLCASLTKRFLLLLLPHAVRVTSAAVATNITACSDLACDRG